MATVKRRVYVQSANGESAWLRPGDTVPNWATVTNPRVLAEEPVTEQAPTKAPEPAAEKPADEPKPARKKAAIRPVSPPAE